MGTTGRQLCSIKQHCDINANGYGGHLAQSAAQVTQEVGPVQAEGQQAQHQPAQLQAAQRE
jgi:hypothetical protein